jgi:hypothetical protein
MTSLVPTPIVVSRKPLADKAGFELHGAARDQWEERASSEEKIDRSFDSAMNADEHDVHITGGGFVRF